MAEDKDNGCGGCLAAIGLLIIVGFIFLCFDSCSGYHEGASSHSSSRSLASSYSSGVQSSGDDRASVGSSSRSSGGSSSESLLDEGDWVDTDDGRTYLKSDSGDGGTDYIDSSGEYVIHKNSDGSGAIADGYGNVAVDSDGDGELDKYSTDNGKSWSSL